jgi:hypothetical protein
MLTTGPIKDESNVVLALGAIRPSHCWVRSCSPSELSAQVWRVVATMRLQEQVQTQHDDSQTVTECQLHPQRQVTLRLARQSPDLTHGKASCSCCCWGCTSHAGRLPCQIRLCCVRWRRPA